MKTESPVQRYQFQVTRTTDGGVGGGAGGGNNGYCTRSTLLTTSGGGGSRGERYSLTPSSIRGKTELTRPRNLSALTRGLARTGFKEWVWDYGAW